MNTEDHVKNERNNPKVDGALSIKKEEIERAINLDYKLMVLESNTSIERGKYEDLPELTKTFNCRIKHLLEYRTLSCKCSGEIKDDFFSRF